MLLNYISSRYTLQHRAAGEKSPEMLVPCVSWYWGCFLLTALYSRHIGTSEDNNNSVALVRERTVPIERLPLDGEVSANFWG
jgi:hypothetical protein